MILKSVLAFILTISFLSTVKAGEHISCDDLYNQTSYPSNFMELGCSKELVEEYIFDMIGGTGAHTANAFRRDFNRQYPGFLDEGGYVPDQHISCIDLTNQTSYPSNFIELNCPKWLVENYIKNIEWGTGAHFANHFEKEYLRLLAQQDSEEADSMDWRSDDDEYEDELRKTLP